MWDSIMQFLATLPLLSLVIWLPIIGGCCLFFGEKYWQRAQRLRVWLVLVLEFVVTWLVGGLIWNFNTDLSTPQFFEYQTWITHIDVSYALAIDGISLPLVVLVKVVCSIAMFMMMTQNKRKQAKNAMESLSWWKSIAILLQIEGVAFGVLMAMDSILFYVFWEMILLPLFFLVGHVGNTAKKLKNKQYAIRGLLYSMAASLLMLLVFIYGYFLSGDFTIANIQQLVLSETEQGWIFLAFIIAFAARIPMLPLHSGLIRIIRHAPFLVSVVLLSLMVNLTAYGLIRFVLPTVPDALQEYSGILVIVALLTIIYTAFVAFAQRELKPLLGYCTMVQMGYVVLGIFLLTETTDVPTAVLSIEGAMIQMWNQGLTICGLLFIVTILEQRLQVDGVKTLSQQLQQMPKLGFLMALFALAAIGMPITIGFIGKFAIMISAINVNFWYAIIVGISFLWMVIWVFPSFLRIAALLSTTRLKGHGHVSLHGDSQGDSHLLVSKKANSLLYGDSHDDSRGGSRQSLSISNDLNRMELAVLLMLLAVIVCLGVMPQVLFNWTEVSIDFLVNQSLTSKLP